MGWFSRKKDRKKEKPNLEEVDNKVESSIEIKQNSEPLEEEKESIADELVTNLNITSRKYVSCTGVDYNVLDRIYFSSEEEKEGVVKQVQARIKSQKISKKLEYREFVQRRGYFPEEGEIDPFLYFILIELEEFNERITTTNGVKKKEKIDCKRQSFDDKVRGFYDVIRFNVFNLKQKAKSDSENFEDEVRLIMETIDNGDQEQRFVQLEGVFEVGKAYLSRNDEERSSKYFNLLLDMRYRVSDSSASGFCRAVGELYEERKDIELAIQWYQKGLELNDKLAVKRKISTLQKEL